MTNGLGGAASREAGAYLAGGSNNAKADGHNDGICQAGSELCCDLVVHRYIRPVV